MLGHEFAHLYYGDNARHEIWKRLAKTAAVSALAAGAAAVFWGMLWMGLIPAALLIASLIVNVFLARARESRADRFAAELVGKEAAIAFLKRVAYLDHGFSLTHPSVERRIRALSR